MTEGFLRENEPIGFSSASLLVMGRVSTTVSNIEGAMLFCYAEG